MFVVSSNFSRRVVSRFSRYRRALIRFRDLGYVKIVSDTLGKEVGVSASQVRKDFSVFGISGNKKGGYRLDELLERMEVILGKDRVHKVILVGVGNIGTALMNYRGFEKEGVDIVAGFDVDPAKLNSRGKVPVFPIDKIESFVRNHGIKTGILAVPAVAAQQVCDTMLSAGIQGILNFAPIRLKVLEDTVVKNVDITNKLENILCFVDGLG